MVSAENDLDYIAEATPGLVDQLRRAGLDCEAVRVPAAGHFYKADAIAVDDRKGVTTVEQAMFGFLRRTLAA